MASQQAGCLATATRNAQFMTNLPNPFQGKQSSFIFIKRMTVIAVSAIVYARNVFQEKDYAVRDVGGISVKILKGGKKRCPGTGCLVQWLEGVYDAIDKQYLRNLYLEVTDNQHGSVLERYELKFSYTDNEPTCTLKNGDNSFSFSPKQMDNTAQAVRTLIRNIFGITTALEPLSGNTSLCMKLQYTDVTPLDYEPEGFRPSEDDAPKFESKPDSYILGNVQTPYHNLKVKCFSTMFTAGTAATHNSAPSEIEPSVDVAGISSQTIIPATLESVEEPLKGKDKSSIVKCLCGQQDKTSVMLQCQVCGISQHAVCYGFFKKEDAPLTHICFDCHSDSNPCSDITLLSKSQEGCQDTCIYRRVLLICSCIPHLSLTKLSQELNVDVKSAIIFMRRLRRDKAFKQCLQTPSLEKPNVSFAIDTPHLHKVLIPRHFNKTSNFKEDDEQFKSCVAPLNQKRPLQDSNKRQKKMLKRSDADCNED